MNNIELYNLLYNAAEESLSPRDLKMFLMRLNITENQDEPTTLEYIGNKVGVTRERVRQIINRSIKKIKMKSWKEEDSSSFKLCKILNEYEIRSIDDLEKLVETDFSFMSIKQFAWFIDELVRPKISVVALFKNLINERNNSFRLEKKQYYTDLRLQKLIEKINWPTFHNKNIDQSLLKPKRDVQTKEHSGKVLSSKMNCEIEYESSLEYRFIDLCENSSFILKYYVQPLIVSYGKNYSYYPDILIVLNDGRIAIIELKDRLHMITTFTRKKYSALISFCEKNGYGYLMTDGRESLEDLKNKQVDINFVNIIKNHRYSWNEYIDVKDKMQIDFSDLAAIILQNDLYFSLRPFAINQ